MTDKLHCSFCGKSQDDVTVLIAGPGSVFICNGCVELCNDIIFERRVAAAVSSELKQLRATLDTASRFSATETVASINP